MGDRNTNQQLIAVLKMIPEHHLPCDLTPAVLQSLPPKKVSLGRRLLFLFREPHIIAVTPSRLAYAAIFGILIWTTAIHLPNANLQTADRKANVEIVPVTFTLDRQEARSVYLIGSFNNWQAEKNAMEFDSANKRWVIKIKVPAGSHEYAFLIDNKIVIADPEAEFFKMDGFGSRNSIVLAKPDDELSL